MNRRTWRALTRAQARGAIVVLRQEGTWEVIGWELMARDKRRRRPMGSMGRVPKL